MRPMLQYILLSLLLLVAGGLVTPGAEESARDKLEIGFHLVPMVKMDKSLAVRDQYDYNALYVLNKFVLEENNWGANAILRIFKEHLPSVEVTRNKDAPYLALVGVSGLDNWYVEYSPGFVSLAQIQLRVLIYDVRQQRELLRETFSADDWVEKKIGNAAWKTVVKNAFERCLSVMAQRIGQRVLRTSVTLSSNPSRIADFKALKQTAVTIYEPVESGISLKDNPLWPGVEEILAIGKGSNIPAALQDAVWSFAKKTGKNSLDSNEFQQLRSKIDLLFSDYTLAKSYVDVVKQGVYSLANQQIRGLARFSVAGFKRDLEGEVLEGQARSSADNAAREAQKVAFTKVVKDTLDPQVVSRYNNDLKRIRDREVADYVEIKKGQWRQNDGKIVVVARVDMEKLKRRLGIATDVATASVRQGMLLVGDSGAVEVHQADGRMTSFGKEMLSEQVQGILNKQLQSAYQIKYYRNVSDALRANNIPEQDETSALEQLAQAGIHWISHITIEKVAVVQNDMDKQSGREWMHIEVRVKAVNCTTKNEVNVAKSSFEAEIGGCVTKGQYWQKGTDQALREVTQKVAGYLAKELLKNLRD